MKRVPDALLVQLRNDIPIRYTLTHITHCTIRVDRNGKSRFQCPVCNKFDTLINEGSNLAHCFTCQNSKNPIDLVITKFCINFRQAVLRLMPHLIKLRR